MKYAYIILVLLMMITISCSDERILPEKPPSSGHPLGGGVGFDWSIWQNNSDEYVMIGVSHTLTISLIEKVSGEYSNSDAEISAEDWNRVQSLIQEIFANHPQDAYCDCCDETLSYSELLGYMHGDCGEIMNIEGCTDADFVLVRDLFKEFREKYFPEENNQ